MTADVNRNEDNGHDEKVNHPLPRSGPPLPNRHRHWQSKNTEINRVRRSPKRETRALEAFARFNRQRESNELRKQCFYSGVDIFHNSHYRDPRADEIEREQNRTPATLFQQYTAGDQEQRNENDEVLEF